MIDDKRYVLVPFVDVTQTMIDSCIQTSIVTLRRIRFAGNADPLSDWTVLKWRRDKPAELWDKYPVYSNQEMVDILLADLNSQII